MKTTYRGFEIEVTREKCLAGYSLVYYSIFRKSDGLEIYSGFYDTEDTVREVIKDMKSTVDDFLENPDDYDADNDPQCANCPAFNGCGGVGKGVICPYGNKAQ
jgi:hypothetical protein